MTAGIVLLAMRGDDRSEMGKKNKKLAKRALCTLVPAWFVTVFQQIFVAPVLYERADQIISSVQAGRGYPDPTTRSKVAHTAYGIIEIIKVASLFITSWITQQEN